MFLGLVAQTKGSDIAEGSSEQQVMELMMSRYYMLCPGYKYFIAHVGSCFLFYCSKCVAVTQIRGLCKLLTVCFRHVCCSCFFCVDLTSRYEIGSKHLLGDLFVENF